MPKKGYTPSPWEEPGWGLTKRGFRPESYPEKEYEIKNLSDMKRVVFMAFERNDAKAYNKALSQPDLLQELLKEPSGEYPAYHTWAQKMLRDLEAKRKKASRRP